MKVSLLTLGCKVNQAEMAEIESALKGKGAEIVALSESPDLCIINTCTVTQKSDYQSRQLIRRAAKTGAKVFVTGCYSELNPELIKSMEGVEQVINNKDKSHIINKICINSEKITLNNSINMNKSASSEDSGRSRLFLKVQDGCDRFCSYCLIPLARGKPTSVGLKSVINSVNNAVSEGFQEVVLTGIHLGLYGRDINLSLTDLVGEILQNTDIKRIRLSSLEINEIDRKLLDLFKTVRICGHLHIPIQSGDDGILSLMKRGYKCADFAEKINEIHDFLGKDVSIGTDVIVGFPGEGEREFQNTYNLLETLPFSYIHVFPFSKRPGTKAAGMANGAHSSVVKERVTLVRRLSARKSTGFRATQVGKTLEVLAETRVSETLYLCTSSNYLKVRASCDRAVRGSLIHVRIKGVDEECLFGDLINTR